MSNPTHPTSSLSTSKPPQGQKYITLVDKFLRSLDPNHRIPSDQEIVAKLTHDWGVIYPGNNDVDLDKMMEEHDKSWEKVINEIQNDPARWIVGKPDVEDPSVLYYRIPKSDLSIRLWDGNLESTREYCLDLFDLKARAPLNLPTNYTLSYLPHFGAYNFGGIDSELVSFEETGRIKREDVPKGEEKFLVPEGAQLVLTRPNHEPFYFLIPARPIIAGPLFAQPCKIDF